MKPLLLDLFCGAGGAGMGYHRAGFEVVGIDIKPQPHYPFAFRQGDALDPSEWLEATNGRMPDAIHASPPCQAHSTLRHRTGNEYPDLIEATRSLLVAAGVPFVIENVMGAPLLDPIVLCGSTFGLGVRRHRMFESSEAIVDHGRCDHASQPEPIDVSGNGGFQTKPRDKKTGGRGRKPKNLDEARAVMDMPWSDRRGISQAIPPAYAEWVGRQLIR